MEFIEFDIGGVYYTTTVNTLSQVPNNVLIRLVSGDVPAVKKENRIFIDRDGQMFKYILNYLRNPTTWNIPENIDKKQLSLEADFYLLSSLVDKLKETPKIKPVISNPSFTYYIIGRDKDQNNLYTFESNGLNLSLENKNITKNDLNSIIFKYVEKFNKLGYKLVTIGYTECPKTVAYYFEESN